VSSLPPSGRGWPRKGGAPGSSAFSRRMASGGDGISTPKWRSNLFILLTLRALGLDPTSGAARTAVDLVRDRVTWGPEFGDSPFFEGEVEPCINGGVMALGGYFGETRDRLVDRLLGEQLQDGGWNCEAERGSVRSSFHTTICVLEGLLAYEKARGATAAVTDARVRAHEYLLERRMFRRLSSGEVVDRGWTRFSFPVMWHYDVLRGLDYLRSAGVEPDERVAEAVGLVAKRRHQNGRWPLHEPNPDPVHFEMENGRGKPSRWNTLRALRCWTGIRRHRRTGRARMKILVKSAWGSDDPTKAVFPFLHAKRPGRGRPRGSDISSRGGRVPDARSGRQRGRAGGLATARGDLPTRPWAMQYPSMCEVRVRGLGESSRVTCRGRMRPSRTPRFSSGSSNGRTSSSASR